MRKESLRGTRFQIFLVLLVVIAAISFLVSYLGDDSDTDRISKVEGIENGRENRTAVRPNPSGVFGTAEVHVDDRERTPVESNLEPQDLENSVERQSGVLEVNCVSHNDKPAADVTVFVTRIDAKGAKVFPRLIGVSNRQGVVRFHDVSVGTVRVDCSPFLRQHGKIRNAKTTAVELKIPFGLIIQGQVLDSFDNPVVGAKIVSWKHGREATLALSKAEGRFQILGLDDREYFLAAFKEGYTPSTQRRLKGSPPGTSSKVTLMLKAGGGRLAGRITNESGDPISGALVELEAKFSVEDYGERIEQSRVLRRRANTNGEYQFEGLGPNNARLRVNAVGHIGQNVEKQIGADSRFDFVLNKGAIVFGVVTDDVGNPVRSAIVRQIKPTFEGTWNVAVWTDHLGRFELSGLREEQLTLNASKPENGNVVNTIIPTVSEPTEWNPVLSSGLKVRGHLMNHEDVPLSGWRVKIRSAEKARRGEKSASVMATTDATGDFQLANCPVGELELLLIDRNRKIRERIRNVWPSESVLRIRFDKRKLGLVSGEIDKSIRDWQQAKFTVTGTVRESGFIDKSTGRFRFIDLPPGDYSLIVRKTDETVIGKATFSLQPGQKLDLGTIGTKD